MPLMWTNLLVQTSVLSHTSHVSTPDGYCSKYHSQDICILACCIACIAHSVNLDIGQQMHNYVCTNSLIITLMEGPKLQNNSFQYKTNCDIKTTNKSALYQNTTETNGTVQIMIKIKVITYTSQIITEINIKQNCITLSTMHVRYYCSTYGTN